MSEIKAVVLGGGGSRGAYEVGVWKALREIGYDYQIVTGTSVGALNGALLAIGDFALAEKMWSQITMEMVLDYSDAQTLPTKEKDAIRQILATALREKSIDQTPLKQLLGQVLNIDALYQSKVDFGLVTVSYPSLEPVALFQDAIPKEQIIDYLMASSACFPAMRIYEFDGASYIDGGYCDNLPIQMAVDRGATEVVAVDLKAPGLHKPAFAPGIPVTVISPKDDLGFVMLFDADKSRLNIQVGYLDGMKAFGRYDGYRYTFQKNSFVSDEDAFQSLLRRIGKAAFTQNPADQLLHKRMARLLLHTLIRYTDKKTVANGWMLPAAEIAARILKLSPLEIYEKNTFDTKLLEALKNQPHLTETGEDLLTRLRTITDDAFLTAVFYRRIDALLSGKLTGQALFLIGKFAPAPLLAALYCYAAANSATSIC